MCEFSVFPIFLENDLFKSRQNPRVDFFLGKKRLRRIQHGVFSFTVAEFYAWWIVYNSHLFCRSFVNLAFPNKKNLAQNRSIFYDKQIWKQMFAEILCFKWIGKIILQEDNVLPRATEPPFLSALHAKNDTTNPFSYKLGESTENSKALLFFSNF